MAAACRSTTGQWETPRWRGAAVRRAGRCHGSSVGMGEGARGQRDRSRARQRRESGLGCARLGGSGESLWPRAVKSALLLIQEHSSRLIAVKNSRKSGVWAASSDGPAWLRREEVRLAFRAANPFPPERTLSSVPGLVPGEGGFPPTDAAVGRGRGTGSRVSRAGPRPVT